MKEVKLYTAKGNYVITVLIPSFMEGHDPDVIIWGERFFRRVEGLYAECFTVVAFTSEEWKKIYVDRNR